jgi:hypothetical protein
VLYGDKPDSPRGNSDVARLAAARTEQAAAQAMKNAVARREFIPLTIVQREIRLLRFARAGHVPRSRKACAMRFTNALKN